MIRVVFFTVVTPPEGKLPNGGTMCSENHIRRLHQDKEIDLFVVVCGADHMRSTVATFLSSLGVEYEFIALKPRNPETLPLMPYVTARLFGFGWDLRASSHDDVKPLLTRYVLRNPPAVILLEYLFSSLFCDMTALSSIPIVMITLNREAELFERMCRENQTYTWRQKVATMRLRRFETAVYRRCAHVVSIGEPDMPSCVDVGRTTCITPYLDVKATNRWRPGHSRNLFFVGHAGHHPNKIAIRFIESIAPFVAATAPEISIVIVGTTHALSPNTSPNVSYLGLSDAQTVNDLFCQSGLMLCPIDNDFGMKFKIAEAISYGTPFVASQEALQCVPYLKGIIPTIDISDLRAAAETIVAIARDRDGLIRISEKMTAANAAFICSQSDVWSRTLRNVVHANTSRAKS